VSSFCAEEVEVEVEERRVVIVGLRDADWGLWRRDGDERCRRNGVGVGLEVF
jgi:hypothetical protein